MSEIILKNVCKTYENKNTVIENLNLTIQDGSFTVLVGPSGCGKSTTLRMIAGLEDISSGELLIDGQRMNEVDPGHRDIAMVFQYSALFDSLNVFDNISFALQERKDLRGKYTRKELEKIVAEKLELVGLSGIEEQFPS